MTEVMRFRRISTPRSDCSALPCQACLAPHLSKVVSAVEQGRPVTFVLPAFPGKSPNPAKVLGHLPDMAERRALEFLQRLCDRIERIHSPGARIILCSDGRVFSDVVGMADEDVTAYQDELSKMIAELGLVSLSTFNLEEPYRGLSFGRMRSRLMDLHGEPLEVLKASVGRGGETHRLYCGITRFLFEDAMFPGQKRSRTAIQKDCRVRAYEVIRRSMAWSGLIEERYPEAVRLSIHPQGCGATKLGIRLIEPDHWQTPWHGVAVEAGGRFVLLKRAQAESLGARLVHRGGRPSHYVLRGFAALGGSEELSGYCERWGEISVWPFGKVLELVERDNPEDHVFDSNYVPLHWDGMYRPQLPEFQLFHCVRAPRPGQGGRTTFSDTVLALKKATARQRALWERVTGTYERKMEFYDSKTVSPVVDAHPLRGFPVIRYNEPPREGFGRFVNPPTLAFSGVSAEEEGGFHRGLREALYSPACFYAHEWQEGDLVVADNLSLLHGREAFETRAPRHLRRVHVLSDPPLDNPRLVARV